MRDGVNPFKLKSEVKPPERITICSLVCIPEMVGYFEGSLDAVKLSLASIRAHTEQAFDLIVFDNGSCKEVIDWLRAENEAGRIDYLILSSRNVGKPNAQRQMLRFAPGDIVVYADSDVYFRPGWLEAELQILNTFPKVGEIGGQPVRAVTHFYTSATQEWIEHEQKRRAADPVIQGDETRKHEFKFERGHLIPDEYTRDYARQFGLDYEQKIKDWESIQDHRVTLKGVTAYMGVAHQQFIISREAINSIPFERFDNAIVKGDDKLNETLDQAGFLQLSTAKPYVYHIGNAITEDWLRDEYAKLVGGEPAKLTKTRRHWLYSRARVRRLLRSMWRWSFETWNKYGN